VTFGQLPSPVRLALAGLCGLFCLLASSPAGADEVSLLSVTTGHSLVIETPGLTRVAVGDGRIASVVPVGNSQIVVNGKGPGHTSIFVWEEGRRLTYEVTVTEQAIDDVARMLRTAIDMPDVQVISFGHSIILRGTVEDGQQFQRLNEIVSRFSGLVAQGSANFTATVVNAVTVSRPLGALQQEIASIPGASGIRLDPDGKGNVIVSGTVRDQVDVERVLNRARGLSSAYLSADGRVIDRLTTESNSQISIKTYILEVDKTGQSDLGISMSGGTASPGNNDPLSVTLTNTPAFNFTEVPGLSTVAGGLLKVGAFARQTVIAGTINLLLSSGHARELASPNIVTTPGREATFMVGGQVPIPLASGNGAISIVYKNYGVSIDVTPTILGNGGIETKIEPQVNEIASLGALQENGFAVPAFTLSTLSTDVITHSGESIVLGGLLRRVDNRTIQKIPGLSALPIIGKLFTSTSYQHLETDVVFVMTPEVISR
jgi:Flp pilus assembly secretin CpaC